MNGNREYLNNLFDIYKDLFTSIEQLTFKNYYFEDLSLQEIADNRSISKSSVGKTLKQVTTKLQDLENTLKVYELKQSLKNILNSKNIREDLINILNKY